MVIIRASIVTAQLLVQQCETPVVGVAVTEARAVMEIRPAALSGPQSALEGTVFSSASASQRTRELYVRHEKKFLKGKKTCRKIVFNYFLCVCVTRNFLTVVKKLVKTES